MDGFCANIPFVWIWFLKSTDFWNQKQKIKFDSESIASNGNFSLN